MRKMKKVICDNRSFTLIELLVVILIVGILASVAIPMMKGYVDRAKEAEAIVTLGSIRTMVKAYIATHPDVNTTQIYAIGNSGWEDLGIKLSDLDGTYFSNLCYTVSGGGVPDAISVSCYPGDSGSPAPKASEVNNSWTCNMIVMNVKTGDVTYVP